MEDCLPADTPMEEKLCLTFPANPENYPSIPYRLVIGKLLYIALSTRPNIAYSVCYLSHFVSNYGREHWTTAKCVLRYLHKTIDLYWFSFFDLKQNTLSGQAVCFCFAG